MRTILCVLPLLVAFARVDAAPGVGQPLTLSRGEVRRIKNVGELKTALDSVNRAKTPTTLLLEDGTYLLDVAGLEILCPGLVIRSAGGNRDAVVVRGPDEGPDAEVGSIFVVGANDVVIADLTLGYCRHHGVQVRGESPFDVSGLLVHNCRLVNCNQQFIKGSSSDADPVGATDGCIEQCLFEFTSGWAYQYYTGGIDIHKGVNWTVRDNLFRNLRVPAGQSGISEHAVHFWKRCSTRPQNVVVERNWIVNCDRGIGFGLGDSAGGFNGGASVIRNNMVFNDGTGPHTDVGIGLEHASNVQVDNNTVVVQKYWGPMEYRFPGSSNLVFRNNLVNRPIQRRDEAPVAAQAGNLERVDPSWFRDFAAGDLRLTSAAKAAIDTAQPVEGFHFQHQVVDEKPPLNPWIKLAGDFNGDGKLDIAIGGQNGPLVWYVNPSWRKCQVAQRGWRTVAGAVGDVDGDGDTDIVPGGQVWFENPRPKGDATKDAWRQHRISDVGTHDVALVDLDRDGKPDLVGRDQSSFGHKSGNRIHFWRQLGPDDWSHHEVDCPHGEGLAVGDLDRDGDADVVIGGRWFENDGRVDGAWSEHVFTTSWNWADTKVALGDINGDKRMDVVLAPAELQGQQYRLAWYEAPAQAVQSDWREHTVVAPVEAVMHGLGVADMDSDGQRDIVAARMHQGAAPREVSVYLNTGKGNGWSKLVVSERGSHDILLADFDADGRPDILGANHGGSDQPVELWLSAPPDQQDATKPNVRPNQVPK